MNEGNTKNLAAKIAKLLESESGTSELTALRHSIEKINDSLGMIEAKLEHTPQTPVPVAAAALSTHPSQDRFAVVEAIVDEVFSQYQKEKACTFEPNGKPCDHCSMCSSRGF
jgi:hypothetical protein